MVCKWQVEIDPYCNKVLAKHWPNVRRHDDVRTFPPTDADEWRVDVICGGFPCQDIAVGSSTASGLDGERSGLWREMWRIVRKIRPRFLIVENSAAILFRGIDRLLADLASGGLDAEWRVFSAYEFGAPHQRERAYVVAYPNEEHGRTWLGAESYRPRAVFNGSLPTRIPVWLQATSEFVGMDDGISAQSYRNRVGAIGNAVVPQIAEWIGRRIVEATQ